MTTRPAARTLGGFAFLIVAVAAAVTGCGPANHSLGCPPGQWRVDVPGQGRECAAGPAAPSVFTPGSPVTRGVGG